MKEIDAAIEALESIHPGNMTPMAEENWNAALAGLRSLRREPVAQLHPNHLKPNQDGTEWCREVLLYSPNNEGDKLGSVNTRVKLYTHPTPVNQQLLEANKLLDAALLKTYPQGCDNGEVFDLWNKARATIAQAEKDMK